MSYVSFLVTTKQKPRANVEKILKKENKANHYGKTPIYKNGQKHSGKEIMGIQKNQKTISKIALVSPHIKLITPSINRLNSSIRRQSCWMEKK